MHKNSLLDNVRIRCMGGSHCSHPPGRCTADPEYQAANRDLGITPEIQELLVSTHMPVGFGIAIVALKCGKRVTRHNWNGKGMYIYMVPANRYPPTTRAGEALASGPDHCVPYRAYIAMKTVDNDVVPWVASQSDLLEEDWLILDD